LSDSPEKPDAGYLTGSLLVAMPGMPDDRFKHTVIYMCDHTPKGAMGLIVNQIADGVDFADLLEQVGIAERPVKRRLAIHVGGPVDTSRGFVLHSGDYEREDTIRVAPRFALSLSVEVLREISRGDGPKRALFALGYAGWGPGQLESEIQQNTWLHVDADDELVFGGGTDEKWLKALGKLGINPTKLSNAAGRA
jgi:putative transcriptional regulator